MKNVQRQGDDGMLKLKIVPARSIDVNRLLSKESPFRDEASWTIWKPKTILLSGLDLSDWPKYQLNAFMLRLTLLDKAGFEIYDGTGEKLIYDFWGRMLEVDLRTIKAVTQLDVPADELMVFDLDFANQFVLGNEGDYQHLIGKSEINFTVPMSFESFRKFLKSNAQCMTSLDLSCCYNLQGENNILDDLPQLPELEALTLDLDRYGITSNQALVALCGKICALSPKLSKLTVPKEELLDAVLFPENISELTLAKAEMTTSLFAFLSRLHKLSNLSLPKITYVTQLNQILDQNCDLEALTFASVQNAELLEKLLNKGFKQLNLFGLDLHKLDKLDQLRLDRKDIDTNVLNSLLLRTRNLKEIDIQFSPNMQGDLTDKLDLKQWDLLIADYASSKKNANWKRLISYQYMSSTYVSKQILVLKIYADY